MNIIAIFYATLIAFFSGIVFTNYSKIERLATNMLISLDDYSIGYIMAKIILGVVYLSLALTLYRLVKAKMDNSIHAQSNIIRIKKTLICLIGIILISQTV